MANLTRRNFVLGSTGLFLAGTVPGLAGLLPLTPRQTAGPFYPVELPLDDDNNLVRVKGQKHAATGQITDLAGQLLDQNGNALSNLRIEIWQCDANGRYRHPRESGNRPIDSGFQGFGHTITDNNGRYRFRTIRPVAYPGRTPHIHVAVIQNGEEPFVTQLYVAGESQNDHDFLYKRIQVEKRHLVTAEFRASQKDDIELQAEWNIVLDDTLRESRRA